MKKHQETLHIYMVPSATSDDGFILQLYPASMSWYSGNDAIKLGEHKVDLELDIPDRQALAVLAVETLQARQKDILVKAEKDRQKLQIKIDALMLLEHF